MFHKTRQLYKIAHGKIWKFFGGVKPEPFKYAKDDPIEDLRIPALITLPVDRHLGEGSLLVHVGDYVKRGQPLTAPSGGRLVPLHASTSGTVLSVAPQILPHPSGYTGLCVTIKTDGLDAAVDPKPFPDWEHARPEDLLAHIRESGIEGLGGALFQTASKLGSALDGPVHGCRVFIVNGCECEPGLSCDDRLMRESAAEIAMGIRIVQHILNPKVTLIAIEDNKPEAAKAMKEATEGIAQVRVIKARYPAGSARSLIRALTGVEIPYLVHTSECGVVVDNVGTVYALKRAVVDGEPLTSRVVTVLGSSMARHGNARVRFGTSVRFILSSYHLHPEYHQRVIMGGPMMGFTLPSIDVPVTKATSCIMAPGIAEIPQKRPSEHCIRCGRCARACPSRLVPYQMYAFSQAGDHAHALKCGIDDCVLCGSCSFVCPSHIDLTIQFRREKAIQEVIRETEKRNERARERTAEHERKEAERKARIAAKRAAALARIAAQKDGQGQAQSEGAQPQSDEAVALERRRLAAERAAKARAAMLKAAARRSAQLAENKDTQESAADTENQAAGEQAARTAPQPEGGPKLPYSLRRAGRRKSAEEIAPWEAPESAKPQLKLVGAVHDENAPRPPERELTRKLPHDSLKPEAPAKAPLPSKLRRRH